MKPDYRKRPWSTLFKTFGFAVVLAFPLAIFADSDITPRNFYLLALFLGLLLALYSDYLWPYWRDKTRSRILDVVSSDEDTSPAPGSKAPENAPTEVPSSCRAPENLSTIKPVDISVITRCLSGGKHRFDRLREYRYRCRYLTSAMLIILMVVFVVIEDFDTYLPVSLAEGGWEIPPYLFGVLFSLCVLVEYNASLIVGKPVSGVFFRDHSEPVASPSEGLEGEEKIGFQMWRNPFGIGTGIYGRPVFGIVLCLGWLLAIGNWAVIACCILVTVLLMKRFRKALELPDGPFALLELRVFDTPAYGQFLELLEGWQYIGVQYRLDGPDTTGHSLTSNFKVLFGRAEELVIKSETELDTALARTSTTANRFERFDLYAMQCSDATWIRALQRTIERCDMVIMLLTDFGVDDAGCSTELKILMDTVPMSKIVLLVNTSTDLHYLGSILNNAWLSRAEDSPNHEMTEGPYIFDLNELYECNSEDDRGFVTIKMQLIDFLYSRMKDVDVG